MACRAMENRKRHNIFFILELTLIFPQYHLYFSLLFIPGIHMDTETQHIVLLRGMLPSPSLSLLYFYFNIVVLKITGSLKDNKMFKLY